jgi:tetratricopeptide (TPR) repeat protein
MILLLAAVAGAQWSENGPLDSSRFGSERGVGLHGQVYFENVFLGFLAVELLANGRSLAQSASLGPDGSFEFHSVAPGAYELQITAGGDVVHRERVIVGGPNQYLTITVPRRGSADRSAGSTVSIRQLHHKVPSEAQKEYGKGRAAARKGDHQTALAHFQKAVEIDPEFADGFIDVGVAKVSLGEFEQAAEQFQKAIDLVPDYTLAIANLSIVMCRLKRYDEAGQAARQALRLDPSLLKMRYILALSLAMKQGHETEALENLERAAAEIPKARLVAADILTHTGRQDEAARQLEQYLRASPEQDADRRSVEEWLAQLRRP